MNPGFRFFREGRQSLSEKVPVVFCPHKGSFAQPRPLMGAPLPFDS